MKPVTSCLATLTKATLPTQSAHQRDIREMEAEAVSMLCCESLGMPGAEFSRGYIQSWGQGQAFTERSAQRIFRAADQILHAGYSGE